MTIHDIATSATYTVAYEAQNSVSVDEGWNPYQRVTELEYLFSSEDDRDDYYLW